MKSELPQNEIGAFVFENDSLKITYGFSSTGQLSLEIENRLDELIYVDWDKSAIVFKGMNISYSSNKAKLRATGGTYQVLGSSSINVNGEITKPSARSYIQPRSSSTRILNKTPFEYKILPEDPFEKIDFGYGKGRQYIFEDDSLDQMMSYIYISTENDSKSKLLNHNFRIFRRIETIQKNIAINSNQFIQSKTTTFGNFVVLVGLSGALVLAISTIDEED